MAPKAPRVVVVGLGPAGPELVSGAGLAANEAHAPEARWARTDRHPAVAALGGHASFDAVYEGAADLADVYREIVARLVDLAGQHGSVLYAVPGSPAVAERTVELLRATPGTEVATVPGLSFRDLAWDRLGVDPLAAGARLVDGQRFEVEAAGQTGPLLVAQCDRRDVLSAVKLAVEGPAPGNVTVLQRLGLPDERVFEVAWDDLDRSFEPDHLTTLWLPSLAAPVGAELLRFNELVRTLRERCPWDRAQTHGSLRPFVIEEAYEVADAIDRLVAAEREPAELDAGIDELEEELGDLLFQVYFHATIATQEGWFTLADVARGIHDKLESRHPHVFGDVAVDGADDVVRNWEQIKRAEKGRTSAFEGIPSTLPSLMYADEVVRKARSIGVEVEPTTADDLGHRLLALVVEARAAGVDPELALRTTVDRFRSHAEGREQATE
jgi:tetrapyrrole methylase family protein/MazG family protein